MSGLQLLEAIAFFALGAAAGWFYRGVWSEG